MVSRTLLVAAADNGLRAGVFATAVTYGFRHGLDWDHIAAITDITSSQDAPRRGAWLATLYAVGHGVVVFVLGVLAIIAGDLIPSSVDAVMSRVVGLTLLALGVYVFYSLLRYGRDFRMRSRWMLIFGAARRLIRRFRRSDQEEVGFEHAHEHVIGGHHHGGLREVVTGLTDTPTIVTHHHVHRHAGVAPDDPFLNYGPGTATLVGMIHGIGAETPTQVLLLLAAVSVGGGAAGIAVLGAFLIGLFASNSLLTLASTLGYLNASKSFLVYVAIAILTGLFSLVLGTLLLLAKDSALPEIFAS